MVNKNNKIFIALSLFIAISDFLFVYINYRSSQATLQENIRKVGCQIQSAFELAKDSTEIRMLQIATFIANDPRVQDAFLKGKKAVDAEGESSRGEKAALARKELLSIVGPSREKLSEEFDFRQIHFHLAPGSLSFLRAHKPEKYGDRMDDVRHTIVTANEVLQSTSGFETGRVYSGIRGVVPVFAFDQQSGRKVHVGAVESGTSFNTMLSQVAEKQCANVAVLLSEDHLKKKVWPNFLEIMFSENQPVAGYFIESSTDPMIRGIINKQGLIHTAGTSTQLLKIDAKDLAVTWFNLRDFKGKIDTKEPDVGIVVAWRDATKEVASFHTSVRVNIVYAILGFLLIECFLFVSIKSISGRLEDIIEKGKEKLAEANKKLHDDIDEREKIESALRLNEMRLADAQRMAHVGNWDWDINNNTLWWSDEIYRIFGYAPQEFVPTYETFLNSVHPEDQQMVKNAVKESLLNKKPYNIEHRIILTDGQFKHVHENAEILYDELGQQPCRMVGTIQDISERRIIEESLQAYRDNLEKDVALRTKDLAEANKQLKSEIKQRLATEKELEKGNKELAEANTALKVLLQQCGDAKDELEEQITTNIQDLIFPHLDAVEIAMSDRAGPEKEYLNLVRSNLNSISTSFSKNINDQFEKLTPREIQIADFIKHGKTNKEIASMLQITPRSVEFHRDNLRKKLGIKKKKINLRSFLLSLS